MVRRQLDGARAIITGASSGIGRALASELARSGCRLVVTARRADLLNQLAGELVAEDCEVHTCPGDVTDPEHRDRLLQFADERLGGLDQLINNAGIGGHGHFMDADSHRLRKIFEVNFFAPVELIRAALPRLRAGRAPIIVNISSVLGHRAVPEKVEYCASKFALHGFSDALRAELKGLGIDVLLVSPSTTETEFFEKAGGGQPSFGRRWLRPMSPDAVARATARGIRNGRHEIILSFGGRMIVLLDRLLPSLADRLVARWG